jgi:hypothetical protein
MWWLRRKREGVRKWPTEVEVAAEVQSLERHASEQQLYLSCPAANVHRCPEVSFLVASNLLILTNILKRSQ